MNKIMGDQKTLELMKSAKPGSVSNYVPMDILAQLPDEYVAVVSKVQYDPAKIQDSFSPVGGDNVMPTTDLMYTIGEARGVHGIPEVSQSFPVYEDVDWSRMTKNDPMAPPEMVRIKVGHKSSKQSWVLESDGSRRLSQVWEVTFNVWERCCEEWSKKPDLYKTPAARRKHFDSEMKFAGQKAEYKAHSKTIRELAGMPTGYKKSQLKDGWMTFHKIQRSPEAIKLDAAARRSAMAKGLSDGGAGTVTALFGQEQLPEPEAQPLSPSDDDILMSFSEGNDIPPDEPKPEHIRARDAMAQYIADGWLKDRPDMISATEQMIGWIDRNGERCIGHQNWPMVLKQIVSIEELVDDGKYVDHGLTLG